MPIAAISSVPEGLRKLSESATPGLWSVSGVRRHVDERSCAVIDADACPGVLVLPTANGNKALEALADAKFTAAAVNFVRSLIVATPADGGQHA